MPPPSPDFDEAFLSRARLGIVAALLVRPTATFHDLKALLDMTQGNLGAHLKKLEDVGYVQSEKAFVDRTPRTTLRLTSAGRRAFRAHVVALERVARGVVSPPRAASTMRDRSSTRVRSSARA